MPVAFTPLVVGLIRSWTAVTSADPQDSDTCTRENSCSALISTVPLVCALITTAVVERPLHPPATSFEDGATLMYNLWTAFESDWTKGGTPATAVGRRRTSSLLFKEDTVLEMVLKLRVMSQPTSCRCFPATIHA